MRESLLRLLGRCECSAGVAVSIVFDSVSRVYDEVDYHE